MVFVPKCTVFSKAVQILWSLYIYFSKTCTTIKKLYNQRKKLYIFGTLSLALNFIHNGVCKKCTVFSKAVQILWSSYIYFQKAVQPLKSCTTKEKSCTSLVHCPWLLILFTMVFVLKCTVFSKAVQILLSSYIYFKKAVQQLKSCTTKEKCCISLVHCPWPLISFTIVFVPKWTVFPKLYKFCGFLICIFLKTCTTIRKLYIQRKKLYIFGTLYLALDFIQNGVCTKMYSFFPKLYKFCGPHIYIFKKLYNNWKPVQPKKKLYIFGTLYLALNFIHNDVCTKMNSFFQSCTNSVVLIYIFSESCTTIEKLYNQRKTCTSLVHCIWLLISFTMVFVPNCTVIYKAVQIL